MESERLKSLIVNEPGHCIICGMHESESEGSWHMMQGDRVFVCDIDLPAFLVGRYLGNVEVNGRILDCLANVGDADSGATLRGQIFQALPEVKQYVMARQKEQGRAPRTASPRDLYQALTRTVVGQDRAKKRVSIAVYEHQRQLARRAATMAAGGVANPLAPEKHNVLIIGPSGSGKTLTAHTMARSLGLPFHSGDATSFSPTGYQGADADTMIHELYRKSGSNKELAERGVVFVDEIDKLANKKEGTSSDFMHMATQGSMLRLIEGKEVKLPQQHGDPFSPPEPAETIRTDAVLWFMAGAFPGLADIVADLSGRRQERAIGFRASTEEYKKMEEQVRTYEILSNASQDTLIEAVIRFGLTSELVGRMPVIVPLAPLASDELRICLTELDHSPVTRQKRLFAESGYELIFDEKLLERIVAKAEKMATGTRALNTLVKECVSEAAFELLAGPSRVRRGRVILNEECLTDPRAYKTEEAQRRRTEAANAIVAAAAAAAVAATTVS